MKELLNWISQDTFCNGILVLLVVVAIIDGIVAIVRAVFGCQPEQETLNDD